MADRNLDAYYYSFEPTGCDAIDAILEAVAQAGAGYHSTEDWKETGSDGESAASRIQAAANASAAAILALIAENEALQASLDSPDELTAEPAGNYDDLRRQFLALRTVANSKCRMVEHWRKQCGEETRETLLANAANVNAERDTNALLTDALEAAEAERDQLRAELQAQQKPAGDAGAAENCRCNEKAQAVQELQAELERARASLREVSAIVDGNIREIVRDLVNRDAGLNNGANPNDIYAECDRIDTEIDAAMGKGGRADG